MKIKWLIIKISVILSIIIITPTSFLAKNEPKNIEDEKDKKEKEADTSFYGYYIFVSYLRPNWKSALLQNAIDLTQSNLSFTMFQKKSSAESEGITFGLRTDDEKKGDNSSLSSNFNFNYVKGSPGSFINNNATVLTLPINPSIPKSLLPISVYSILSPEMYNLLPENVSQLDLNVNTLYIFDSNKQEKYSLIYKGKYKLFKKSKNTLLRPFTISFGLNVMEDRVKIDGHSSININTLINSSEGQILVLNTFSIVMNSIERSSHLNLGLGYTKSILKKHSLEFNADYNLGIGTGKTSTSLNGLIRFIEPVQLSYPVFNTTEVDFKTQHNGYSIDLGYIYTFKRFQLRISMEMMSTNYNIVSVKTNGIGGNIDFLH